MNIKYSGEQALDILNFINSRLFYRKNSGEKKAA